MMELMKSIAICLTIISSVVSCTRTAQLSYSTLGAEDANNYCESPKVCIKNGCIRGKIMDGYNVDFFEGFLGIPFAKPPVGSLRFQNPVPIEPWKAILNATTEQMACTQKNDLIPDAPVIGGEDCLFLYVYRPKGHTKNKKHLSVMVYIHGGGYFAGSAGPSILGPQYFMDTEDIILVSLQYRLGAMGFLSTGDKFAPGNFGLKDQSLAIRWVHENIKEFGGNPKMITIFGQSAGAAAVHMHMMSPLSKGYFSKAIVMSGSALAPYNSPTKDPLQLVYRQAEAVSIKNARNLTSKNLVEELKKIDSNVLIQSVDALKFWSVDPLTIYRPVVEDQDNPASFLTDDPKELWRKGKYHPVPWMTGYVQNEGAVRAIAITSNPQLLQELNNNFNSIIPQLMEIAREDDGNVEEWLWKIEQRYLNGSRQIRKENAQNFVNLYSERAFLYPMNEGIKQYVAYADTNKNPVSLYKFSYKGPFSYSLFYTGTPADYGVVHCDDLIYLFQSPILGIPQFDKRSTEAKVTQTLVKFYVDFAKNGVATQMKHRKCEASNNISLATECDFLEFTNTKDKGFAINVINEIDEEMISFWRQLDT